MTPRVFVPLGSLWVALSLAACGGSQPASKDRPPGEETLPLVRVVAAELRKVQAKIETTAYLEAEHTVTVFSRVAGRVVEVPLDEGQRVDKGQLLARLDAREAQATFDQTQVQLEQKKVQHQLAKLEADATEHRENQAAIELEKATTDLQRHLDLDSEFVSPRDIDDARYARSKADDSLKVAQFNTRKARLDVEAAAQAVSEQQARLEEVRLHREEHEIRAPIGGVVSQRFVKGGEAIQTATPLFEVVDMSQLISYLDRPQKELGLVEHAKTVLFTAEAYPDREFSADIDLVAPVVDRSTGSFKIRVRVRGDDAAILRPGLFIRARILTEDDREALMVPKTAVIPDGEDAIVFFVRDPVGNRGKARRLRLETGLEDDTAVECRNRGLKGLRPGDLVIVSGQQDLRDQTEVEISRD